MDRNDFIKAKRIVIKVGTNVLRGEDGQVSLPRVYSFIEDISKLVKAGTESLPHRYFSQKTIFLSEAVI